MPRGFAAPQRLWSNKPTILIMGVLILRMSQSPFLLTHPIQSDHGQSTVQSIRSLIQFLCKKSKLRLMEFILIFSRDFILYLIFHFSQTSQNYTCVPLIWSFLVHEGASFILQEQNKKSFKQQNMFIEYS